MSNTVIDVLLLVVGSVGALTPVIGNAGVIGLLALMGPCGAALGPRCRRRERPGRGVSSQCPEMLRCWASAGPARPGRTRRPRTGIDRAKTAGMANVAMIVGPGFEDSEVRVPLDRLREAGHDVTLIGTQAGQDLTGKRGNETVRTDAAPTDRDPASFAALVLPGGHGPDKIRTDEDIVTFVRRFVDTGKPVAAICHGPQLLIEADAVRGKRMTSYASVKTDLKNAGADWVDEELVEDGALITSRKPDDLEAFSKALLARL